MQGLNPGAGRSSPQTILIIDDERSIRNSISLFLEDLDYLVLESETGSDGLAQINQQHPDLVLLDLRMPGMNGLEVLNRIQQEQANLPVVVISGTGLISDVVEALRSGAWDFLIKPINDLTLLQHTIEKALERARLKRENLEYQDYLEEKVSRRTAALERAYDQLTISEQKYRAIFDNLLDIYFETGIDGRLLEISPSVNRISSFTREQLIGRSIWNLYVDPSQRERLLERLQQDGRVEDYEVELRDGDGRIIHFSINAKLEQRGQDEQMILSGVLRDISERKEAEMRLRSSMQTLEALFDAAPLAILAIDGEMRISLWNQAAERMFGWAREDIIGRPYPLAPPGREQEAQNNLALAMGGEEFRGHEVVRQHKDGHQIIVNLSTAPLKDAENQIIGQIVILEDVSELRRLRSANERSSRLASLGELAAGVAHEINNPNGLILLNLPTLRDFVNDALELQQRQLSEGQTARFAGLSADRAATAFPQLISEIEDSARRIRQIVDDLKNFSRQDAGELPELFDLNDSVRKALRLTANHLKKATDHFSVNLAEALPQIKGSPQRVEQVIVNLLVNACEALTDRSQAIVLETYMHQQEAFIILQVRDQGCGISPEHLDHITDPFFTTRREQGGTGLGLSVSARIIREHYGELSFQSKPGQGTTAKVSLPAAMKGREDA